MIVSHVDQLYVIPVKTGIQGLRTRLRGDSRKFQMGPGIFLDVDR